MEFLYKEVIDKGYSNDLKYKVIFEKKVYLLKQSNIEFLNRKNQEFKYSEECFLKGVSMCEPIKIFTDNKSVFTLYSWIDGHDAKDLIYKYSDEMKYDYGYRMGQSLKKIHSINVDKNVDWEKKFNNKIDVKIKNYIECNEKYDNDYIFIDYIQKNRNLLKGRPIVFQHGDFHINNMMFDNKKDIYIIDFEKFDFGDPWEEFNRIVWSAQISFDFASGIIDGYFEKDVPSEFWKLLCLYISSNVLSSLPWATSINEKEVISMKNQANVILKWFNNMECIIPTWYNNKNNGGKI